MELGGKVALVTGASRGIGAATAKLLASKGAIVGINYCSRGDAAGRVIEEIRSNGGQAVTIQADVTEPSDVQRMVESIAGKFGRLDILVNNAGGPAGGSIESVTEYAWRRAIAVHLEGPFCCVRAALPHMKKQAEGAIVNISSVAGLRGCPESIAYQTVKGAILAFTRSLARDLADFNIRVNCVSPGIIRTDFHAAMSPKQQEFNMASRIPLHREGTPQQVAEAIVLLISNDYITGENLVVDGGLTMRIA